MLVQVPLTENERAAVEGDHDAVDRLLNGLIDTPTPGGTTPREIAHVAAPDRVPPLEPDKRVTQ